MGKAGYVEVCLDAIIEYAEDAKKRLIDNEHYDTRIEQDMLRIKDQLADAMNVLGMEE